MKKILVTGSSSGIGAAITQALLTQGKTVVGLCRHHPYQAENYQGYSVDFNAVSTLQAFYQSLLVTHSDIDAIICCAGYGHFVSLEEFSFEAMQSMMNVNFLSQALLIKTFLPELKKRQGAKIIVIGSECALSGQKKGTLYCASKHALRGFVHSLREECRQREVAVSMVNPGMVATPFFDRLAFCPGKDKENAITAAQVASMVEMLLSLENNCVVEEINCQPMKKVIQSRPLTILSSNSR